MTGSKMISKSTRNKIVLPVDPLLIGAGAYIINIRQRKLLSDRKFVEDLKNRYETKHKK